MQRPGTGSRAPPSPAGSVALRLGALQPPSPAPPPAARGEGVGRGRGRHDGRLVEFVTPLHKRAKRSYVERMLDDKVHCMKKARE